MTALQVVLVDDSRLDVELTLHAFKQHDVPVHVTVFGDPRDGLRYLHDNGWRHVAGRPCVDLVLLDVNMPALDGFDVLCELRRDEKLRRLPIVMFSTSVLAADRQRGLRGGADAFVVKPFEVDALPHGLVQILDSLTRRRVDHRD